MSIRKRLKQIEQQTHKDSTPQFVQWEKAAWTNAEKAAAKKKYPDRTLFWKPLSNTAAPEEIRKNGK